MIRDLHPEGLPVWPYMFVTVACGAISGFHATQSPMIAKCITSERQGRYIFYGAMIALMDLGQSGTVYEISQTMLGRAGGALAVVGVVVCPITSGDTAFRSARLILAEITRLDQKKIVSRLLITLPLLGVGAVLTRMDFNVLWRYFSWSNQTLAMVALWVMTAYLVREGKKSLAPLITALPAAFMSAVSVTYILMAEEGFGLSETIAWPAGVCGALALFAFYLVRTWKKG